MDKVKERPPFSRWAWLPEHMPGVAKLMQAKRAELGAAHVQLCWERGVVQKEPGWFFAREGALAVGTAWPEMADIAGWNITPTQAIVVLRPVGV